MKTPILLFAAGLGTRMGELVKDRPKPLIRVAGRPLIDYALDLTDVPGVGRQVVNLHYKGDMIREYLQDRGVHYSNEADELLETGGGLRHALPHLKGNPVLTLNTDAIWKGGNPVTQILGSWRDEMEALLLIVPKSHVFGHSGKGDFEIGADGRLHRAAGSIYTGLQMIRTESLENIKARKFSMNVIWDQIAERGGLYGATYTGAWCDVGQPSSIPLAEAMLDV